MEILRLDIPDRLSIFQLPNTSTSKGYNLGDWKQQIWEGGLKIYETNDKLIVRFFSRDGKQFAQLEVPEKFEEAIVKCEDSVRGYALRLNNPKGGYTWIGLGFRDRNTAFDFRSRIIDFSERRNEDSTQAKQEFEKVEDLSLKSGEKVSFNIGGGAAQKKQNQTTHQDGFTGFSFGMPGQQTQNVTSTNTDTWSGFDGFGSSQQTQQTKQTDFFGDFSDFSNFGSSNTQQTQANNDQQWAFNPSPPQQQQQYYQQPPQQQQQNQFAGNFQNQQPQLYQQNQQYQQQQQFQQPPQFQQQKQQNQQSSTKGTTINLLDL